MSNENGHAKEEKNLLRIERLCVAFPGKDGKKKEVVKGVSFSLREGEILGIAGESGSGKSMTALAIMGLLPENATRDCEGIFFDGQTLCGGKENNKKFRGNRTEKQREEKVRQELSGSKMTMIFQEPLTSLNPVLTIKKQMEEPLLLHTKLSSEERERAVVSALTKAELKNAKRLLNQYPHQLSGGMRQRVMIAMAMINKPRLLICDEPTTALDAVTEREIVSLIHKLAKEQNTAVIFISHDLSVLRNLCDRVMIMKDGKTVEEGTAEQVFERPEQDYTKNLMQATVKGAKEATEQPVSETEVLSATKVSVVFRRSNGWFRVPELKQAVSEVSLSVKQGEIFGIVGESGCGKSTLLKALAGLLVHYEGTIWKKDSKIGVQMVFQDPYTSLNPAKKVGWILEEPLRLNTGLSKEEREQRVREILKETELPEEVAERHVSELSGGQRQRVAIAAALITKPELVLLDEPVSALDVTVQAQILELLLRLQREHNLTYIFVSHDMAVVRKICDRVMVMKDGRVVECGETEDLFVKPQEEYTKKLLG
ncbi:MAG: ABC transporter ATP-binding protein [Lachnospiraceae bacterium]|nr:ABC transporter ATP-binding protein [Lachnospiraceae bacterium]